MGSCCSTLGTGCDKGDNVFAEDATLHDGHGNLAQMALPYHFGDVPTTATEGTAGLSEAQGLALNIGDVIHGRDGSTPVLRLKSRARVSWADHGEWVPCFVDGCYRHKKPSQSNVLPFWRAAKVNTAPKSGDG